MPRITHSQLHRRLLREVSKFEFKQDAADHYGIENSQFSRILAGKMPISDLLAAQLGYKKSEVLYAKLEG